MSSDYSKPLPVPSEVSQPFWDGLKDGRVRVQRCGGCLEYVFYPRVHCPACLSTVLEWVEVSGRGKVYSHTVVRRAMNPAFSDDVPYVYAIVELVEGPRVMTNVVNCAVDDVRVEMAVRAVFDRVTAEVALLKFEPA